MSWLSNLGGDISNFVQKDIWQPIEGAGKDVANVWNEQPTWAKGLEIGAGAGLATFGLADLAGLGAAGFGAADAGAAWPEALDLGGTIGPGAGFGGDVAAAGDSTALALAEPAGDLSGSSGIQAINAAAPIQSGGDTLGGGLGTYEGNVISPANPALGGGGGGGGAGGWLSGLNAGLKTWAPTIGAAGLATNLAGGAYQKYQQMQLSNSTNQKAAQEQAIANADTAAAQPELATGEQLQQFLTTGTLPQAFQAQLDQATASAKAARIQAAAQAGQSTNPEQNTALAQDLAAIDNNALSAKANIEQTLSTAGTQMVQTATQMLAQGATATEISANLPVMIANLNIALNQQTTQAISSFAAALNGKTPSFAVAQNNSGGVSYNA